MKQRKLTLLCLVVLSLFPLAALAYPERYSINDRLNVNDNFIPILAAEAKNYEMQDLDIDAKHGVARSAMEDNSESLCLDIKVEKAGELKSVLGDNIHKVNVLHVEGPINYDDYNTIWESTFYGRLKEVYLDKAEPETDLIPAQTFFHLNDQKDWATGHTYVIWLEKIVLPKNIREIGRLAFAYAMDLKEIVFPENLEIIGDAAFTNCEKFSAPEFILPPNLEKIGYQAFMYCRELEGAEVVLPETVRVIDGCAFYGTYIANIKFPSNLEFLGMSAFTMCRLKEAIIPDGCVLEAQGCQFSSNYELERVHLPDSSTIVPNDIFRECISLKEVNIPKNAKKIGACAFEGCDKLEYVDFPEGLEIIENGAFNRCAAFHTLYFPSTLKTLGASCFRGCKNILEIECKAIVPPVCDFSTATDNPFISMLSTLPVYVPVNSSAAYATAYGWNYFKNFAETEFSGIENVETESSAAENGIYDLMGRKVANPVSNQLYIKDGKKYIYKD